MTAAINAINYCIGKGIKVANHSWSGGAYNAALDSACTAARNAGHIIVAAAGNGGFDGRGDNNNTIPAYPASYTQDNIIAVAAIDNDNKLTTFSNYGSTNVDLGAPGKMIASCYNSATNSYVYLDGTSMAAPHVTGRRGTGLEQEPDLDLLASPQQDPQHDQAAEQPLGQDRHGWLSECEQRDPLSGRDSHRTPSPARSRAFHLVASRRVRECRFLGAIRTYGCGPGRDSVHAPAGSRGDASRRAASTLGLLEPRRPASRVSFCIPSTGCRLASCGGLHLRRSSLRIAPGRSIGKLRGDAPWRRSVETPGGVR